ncbi:hypothetical protein [Virgibacillus siamensis]|uniref:hypothetical protein n=1 Tax=Virgibacillus siamensis TaxID=480071 RepID=UPI0009846ADB|nr:hypothetical protein [Virgibacillus siamensis]
MSKSNAEKMRQRFENMRKNNPSQLMTEDVEKENEEIVSTKEGAILEETEDMGQKEDSKEGKLDNSKGGSKENESEEKNEDRSEKKNRLKSKFNEKKVEDSHSRRTFLVENELLKRLDKLAKNKHGFKTEFINYAIESALDDIENEFK